MIRRGFEASARAASSSRGADVAFPSAFPIVAPSLPRLRSRLSGFFRRRARACPRLPAQRGRHRQDSRCGTPDPAARPAGAARKLWGFGIVEQPTSDDDGRDFPALFDVEADHLRRRHDAGGRRQDVARRSPVEIHSGVRRRRVAVEQRDENGKVTLATEPLVAPDPNPRPAPSHLGHYVRILRRQPRSQALCEQAVCLTATSTTRSLPNDLRNCRSPNSRARCGTTGIRATLLGRRRRGRLRKVAVRIRARSVCWSRSACPIRRFTSMTSKRDRVVEPLPGDRFKGSIAGLGDPILRRRWESGGAGMVGTMADYARFAQMLLNGGSLDGRQYLKPETVRLMASDHTAAGVQDRPRPVLLSGRRQQLWARLCGADRWLTRRFRPANIAGTASAAPSSLSIPRTTCLRSA